jgi:hypothetical protein
VVDTLAVVVAGTLEEVLEVVVLHEYTRIHVSLRLAKRVENVPFSRFGPPQNVKGAPSQTMSHSVGGRTTLPDCRVFPQ